MEPEQLLSEVQNAIRVLKLGKSAGTYAVTAELIKSAGEKAEIFYHILILKIWKEKSWPEDWLKSIFVPIPKKATHYNAAKIEPLL